jgi:hypothetical protein
MYNGYVPIYTYVPGSRSSSGPGTKKFNGTRHAQNLAVCFVAHLEDGQTRSIARKSSRVNPRDTPFLPKFRRIPTCSEQGFRVKTQPPSPPSDHQHTYQHYNET